MSKILHVFPYEKFTFDYIKSIERCYKETDHTFLIYGVRDDANIKEVSGKNIVWGSSNELELAKDIIRYIDINDRTVLHSLFLPLITLIVFSQCFDTVSKKVFWNIWGGDLYNVYWERKEGIIPFLKYMSIKKIAKSVKAVGYIPSDYEFLKEIYHVCPSFSLGSYCYNFEGQIIEANQNSGVNILIGNSATRSCMHVEAIELIKQSDMDISNVYCVLSYPRNDEYVMNVINSGEVAFGEKFVPLTEFMSQKDYMELLSTIDIAVFNNCRQQALGNIASLLYLGKKVYISKDNGCLGYFRDMGAYVYEMTELKRSNKSVFDEERALHNRKTIEHFYSDKQFMSRWNRIFYDDIGLG